MPAHPEWLPVIAHRGVVRQGGLSVGDRVRLRIDAARRNLPPTAPFGGVKWSGIGRENGRWGIEEFCELQVVNASRV
jgi:aldehyde dehydrogenase family protein